MSTPASNIRVFVHWTEQTVFAGEDIDCTIVFKNIATGAVPSRTSLYPGSNGLPLGAERKGPATQSRASSNLSPRRPTVNRGHRSTLSLNTPAGSWRARPDSGSWTGGFPKPAAAEGHDHKRSLSIISIGAGEGIIEDTSSSRDGSRRGPRSHGRSASLQIVPRRGGVIGGPTSAPLGPRSSAYVSSLFASSFPSPDLDTSIPMRQSQRLGAMTAPSTPSTAAPPRTRPQPSPSFTPSFKFPATSDPSDSQSQGLLHSKSVNERSSDEHQLLSPRVKESTSMVSERVSPVARVLSPASITGTPRSSGEFYSLSNNSTETLASEYLPQKPGRVLNNGGHIRRPSNLAPVTQHRPPETLMMGFAQIHGSFTLDASLISQTPFEEVKRKGTFGGQGGGVIGVESQKRDSGLLRSFGWGNIGESLGGLLGGGELSSMKEMRGVANSRSIPLLSTPQSILFVDLRLAPGQSRSYRYSFKLPRGLPPSHRGKAIKISYKLVVGTQRPGGAREQQITSVEVPFRILGSVNSHGELLGHDLMAPYIILNDQARVKSIDAGKSPSTFALDRLPRKPSKIIPGESNLEDFLAFTDGLLTKPRQSSSLGLLSPTEFSKTRRQSSVDEPVTAREAIDMAILRSNIVTDSQQSANRFEIARSGKRVAVVMLVRPSYRLGETVAVAVDFTDAEIPCYAIHAALETSESVESGIALRSEASILRVTRRVHVSHSESTLFARRIVFSPTIPVSATPEFITSGVSLHWKVRIEFVTPQISLAEQRSHRHLEPDLVEEVSRDERGVVLAAAEVIECESFEISVPLRVYGALAGNTEDDERSSEAGLVV
ncbi:putative RGP1 [Coleophoma crateriformis]|uniref:Putative RGP1 n=1 Tax=Coleophoma crateriformis TaxID=565419 RepID=A0A3D8RNT6_9HELO|nr:putative RGP1 [Coleophoma crateriformis]